MHRLVSISTLGLGLSACLATDIRIDCTEPSPLCDDLDDDYIKPPELNENPWASEVTITRISVLQGTTVDVMEKGDLVDDNLAGIYPGRAALVRVYFETGDGWEDRDISAQLLGPPAAGKDKPTVIQELKVTMGGGVSAEDQLNSTINFSLDADDITEDMELAIELREWEKVNGPGEILAPAGDGVGPRWPVSAETYEVLDTEPPTDKVRIALVPVKYDADGSGRIPDLGETQLDLWRDMFTAQYPLGSIELRILEPTEWNQVVSANGTASWSTLLGHIASLRTERGVESDEYIFGVFNPADSPWAGIYGLSSLGGSAEARSSIGVGWPGAASVNTALHEVGHAHGRNHAPCGGAGGPDPSFPYSDGGIGPWGYNLVDDELIDPSTTKDFMSYCDPTWPSDYTFHALFQRIRAINAQAKIVVPDGPAQWEQYFLHPDGRITYIQPVRTPPDESTFVDLTITDDKGTHTLRGSFSPFSHAEGGSITVPVQPLRPMEIQLGGDAWFAAPQ